MRCDDGTADLCRRVEQIESAFPLDDLGKPDFHAHRKSHRKSDRESATRQEIMDATTKQIIGWVVGIVLMAVSAFFGMR